MLDGRRRALEPGRDYLIKHTTRTTRVRVTALDYRLDVNTLHRDKDATALKLNELGRVSLRTQVPLLLDEYTRNASTGSFILIDPHTNGTVAAGMVLREATTPSASPNTVRHTSLVTAEDRLTTRPHAVVHRAVGVGQVVGGDAGRAEAARKGHSRLSFSTATICGTASMPTSASPWPTAPRTCAGWLTSRR